MYILGPIPDPLNQKLWGWVATTCVLTCFPGDSEVSYYLRKTEPEHSKYYTDLCGWISNPGKKTYIQWSLVLNAFSTGTLKLVQGIKLIQVRSLSGNYLWQTLPKNESFSESTEEFYEDRIYDSVFYCLMDNWFYPL